MSKSPTKRGLLLLLKGVEAEASEIYRPPLPAGRHRLCRICRRHGPLEKPIPHAKDCSIRKLRKFIREA